MPKSRRRKRSKTQRKELEQKLPMLARDRLRRELRSHPDIRQHITNPARVDVLEKPDLLELAQKLSIDVKRLVRETMETGKGREAVWEEEELRSFEYSEEYPGFAGQIEFDVCIELFGRRIKRKGRVDYTHTPSWEYFDLKKRALHVGWEGTSFTMSLLPVPERWLASGRRKVVKGEWIQVGELLQDGIFPESLYDRMYAAIDRNARVQDVERRRLAAAGKRLPPAPIRDRRRRIG